ncbi:hypothetical protein [Pontibacterium sp.]|uniref:hypothetical protein n=1 Tax=Pontibacterium sp. TaxID=2036026 RepID=UPI00356766FD
MLGSVAALWGFAGISLILGSAIYRLSQIAWQMFEQPFSWYHWAALAFSVAFMGFAEGYRGFQKAFSPRVAARIYYLSKHVTPMRALLAPLFCMGYFHVRRKRQIVTVCLTLGIIVLVQFVHMLEQPWRGIVDAGVVVGLTWGLLSIALFSFKAFFGNGFNHSPETP